MIAWSGVMMSEICSRHTRTDADLTIQHCTVSHTQSVDYFQHLPITCGSVFTLQAVTLILRLMGGDIPKVSHTIVTADGLFFPSF